MSGKRKRMTWGQIYYANLARGYDHGYAAFRADEAERFWDRKQAAAETLERAALAEHDKGGGR